jgi:hypothetical protein
MESLGVEVSVSRRTYEGPIRFCHTHLLENTRRVARSVPGASPRRHLSSPDRLHELDLGAIDAVQIHQLRHHHVAGWIRRGADRGPDTSQESEDPALPWRGTLPGYGLPNPGAGMRKGAGLV